MWFDILQAVFSDLEAITLSLVAIATGLASVAALFRGFLKKGEKPKEVNTQSKGSITVGLPVAGEERWLIDLRSDADKADELYDRLNKALLRLAENGLPYDDI